ncbi:MAG: hypothetical protein ACRDDY_07970 [Clostridium sp.]|uniref:hypothetical protein n=1 Tax=Clostridium sp. TaxID=1506 RepID=UPI003EE57A13
MEIIKYIKNNVELKKEILKRITWQDIELKVACYTSSDDKAIITDLEVSIYVNGEYDDVVSCYSVESVGDFQIETDKHRKELSKLKKRVFNYLKVHFNNVEFSDDYTQ